MEKAVCRWRDDLSSEAELSAFMDENFYKRLCATGGFITTRVKEKKIQQLGCDVLMKHNSVIVIDEKAQLYYVNRNLPTFAFELSFLNPSNEVCCGWLLNNNLLTTHYMLLYPNANVASPNEIKKSNITEVEAILISKETLLSYLDSKGFTKEAMMKAAQLLRKHEVVGKGKKDKTGVYYFATDPKKYRETPINVVVPKKTLIELSELHCVVTPYGFKVVKAGASG